jgi:hypothetical protein
MSGAGNEPSQKSGQIAIAEIQFSSVRHDDVAVQVTLCRSFCHVDVPYVVPKARPG